MPKMCGIAKHPLVDGVLVTDPQYWKFIRRVRIDYREDDEVCTLCKNCMERVYWSKKGRAEKLRQSRDGRVSMLSSLSEKSQQSTSSKNATNILEESRRQSINGIYTTPPITGSKAVTLSLSASRDNSLQSRSNTSATNMPQETYRQSLNDSDEKSSTSSTESDQSSVVTVIRKKVLSPTIYDLYPTETNYFTNSLNLRLSQEPTTSAAASKAKGTVQVTNPAVTNVTPRSRDIREFFKPLQVKRTEQQASTSNQKRPLNGKADGSKDTTSNSDDDSTACPSDSENATKRTEQASTSNQKRPLNDKAGGSKDTTSNSDDDDQIRSLNYYNPDVRFPQYQPIPKRRRFHHNHSAVMDMYIKGLTGG